MPLTVYIPLPGPLAYTPPQNRPRISMGFATALMLAPVWLLIFCVVVLIWIGYGATLAIVALWRALT